MIASAISGADWAPRSSPMGTRTRASWASVRPSSRSRFKIAAPRRELPRSPMYPTSVVSAWRSTGRSYL